MSDEAESEERLTDEMIPALTRHLEEEPGDAAVWFDLGLIHKRACRWNEAVAANERALAISSEPEDPAWWNLGIAATGLHDWRVARRAWRGYGVGSIEEGAAPILASNFGSAPVRLPHGEVVWGPRICPARVCIKNIPFPEFGYRWGDIVLHDGAPNGERQSNGRTYGVFDVLEMWQRSELATLTANVTCSIGDAEELVAAFDRQEFAAENWTRNVRRICAACSRGSIDGHSHPPDVGNGREHHIGIAAPMEQARDLLARWAAKPFSRRKFTAPVVA